MYRNNSKNKVAFKSAQKKYPETIKRIKESNISIETGK